MSGGTGNSTKPRKFRRFVIPVSSGTLLILIYIVVQCC